MKKNILRNYARLLAETGLNIKKGDYVRVHADLDQPEFVEMVVTALYKAGAAKVTVEWHYQPLQKVNVKYQSLKLLGKVEDFELERLKFDIEKNMAVLHIVSEDPDGLKGMDQKKSAKARQMRYPVIKPYSDQMENKYKWCIAAVPGKAWAKKVFPGERTSVAVEKLWNAILYTARVIGKNGEELDPVIEWHKHNLNFKSKCDYLNSLGLKALQYNAANGTNLRVGLIDDGIFLGGGEDTLETREFFNPNIPTEEVFTSPKAGDADGIVYSSMPLSYRGQVIENFSVKFEGGKVVEVKAEKNEDLLREMVNMDAGASMLGECALVPFTSPIRQSGVTFYETLFDENAACHLALGMGFANCIKDYGKYTLDEARAKGINDSMIHVDFMIGTEDLSVTGITKDGREVPIFRNGVWAF